MQTIRIRDGIRPRISAELRSGSERICSEILFEKCDDMGD